MVARGILFAGAVIVDSGFYQVGDPLNSDEYRFCPRCGGRLELRRIKAGEPGRLVCRECGFVLYLGPKLVAGALFELDGGIVLIQRAIEPGYGKWTFPGGFVERGERAEAAAEREVLEESGVEIEVTEIVGLYTYEGQLPAIAVFAARAIGGEPAPLDETMAVRSFPRDCLPWSEMAFPSTEHTLKDYLRKF
jgi:ADP-ribose pyrophosphatase YjhB (NUDIX family)/ribosomal protein S27AE